jgi:hypothetical protein
VAIGSLAAVALFAAGCLLIIADTPTESIEPLTPSTISSYKGAYVSNLPAQTFPGLFVPVVGEGPEDLSTFLREDYQPLDRVFFRATARPIVAPGQFAVRDGFVFFAPAGETDPRTSGHAFAFGVAHEVGAPFYVLVLTLVAWSGFLLLWLRPQGWRMAPADAVEAPA